jgi:hypothetical protein
LIPLFCDLFLPVLVLFDLFDFILDYGKGLSNFKIFHELVVVKIISKLEKLVYLGLLSLFLFLLGGCPGGSLTLLGRLGAWQLAKGFL